MHDNDPLAGVAMMNNTAHQRSLHTKGDCSELKTEQDDEYSQLLADSMMNKELGEG
jgi:hypothetical protein